MIESYDCRTGGIGPVRAAGPTVTVWPREQPEQRVLGGFSGNQWLGCGVGTAGAAGAAGAALVFGLAG
jgi:hypothetical protein